jgi:hypothetical protein
MAKGKQATGQKAKGNLNKETRKVNLLCFFVILFVKGGDEKKDSGKLKTATSVKVKQAG